MGETYVWDHGYVLEDFASIRAFCLEEDKRLRVYVEDLDASALAEPLSVGSGEIPRWLIIAHVVNHGTQHRSEPARYLTTADTRPEISI